MIIQKVGLGLGRETGIEKRVCTNEEVSRITNVLKIPLISSQSGPHLLLGHTSSNS